MLTSRAFTLIELLLSLTLLAILLFFAVPFASSMHEKNQIQVIQDDIRSAIRFAKTQAMISGNNILLTPLPDSNDWSNGMLLFVDNPKHHYTADTQPLQKWQWFSSGIQVTWKGFQSSHYLLFSADLSKNATNGTFIIRNQSQIRVKLVVNRLGMVHFI